MRHDWSNQKHFLHHFAIVMLSAQQLFEDPIESNSIIHPKNCSICLLRLVRYSPQYRRPTKKRGSIIEWNLNDKHSLMDEVVVVTIKEEKVMGMKRYCEEILLRDFVLECWLIGLNYRLDFLNVLHFGEVQHIQLVIARINNDCSLNWFLFLHRQFQGEFSIVCSIHRLNFDYARKQRFIRESIRMNVFTSSCQVDVEDWDGSNKVKGVRKRMVTSLIASSSCFKHKQIKFVFDWISLLE